MKRTQGFVEVTPAMQEGVLEGLVPVAYGASRTGTVVFALNGIAPQALERHMDRAVKLHGLGVQGVLYLRSDPADPDLLGRAAEADFVIADSVELSRALSSQGIRHMGSREGMRYLDGLVKEPNRFGKAAPQAPPPSRPARPPARDSSRLASL